MNPLNPVFPVLLFFVSFILFIFLFTAHLMRKGFLVGLRFRLELLAARSRLAAKLSDFLKPKKKEASVLKMAVELGVFLLLIYAALSYKVFWVAVVSNSMYPTFERGDMVLVQSLFVDPEPGDIVMFNRPDLNYPVTHRVLKIIDGKVYTGGDASGPDSFPISRKDVVGEAILIFGKPIVLKGVGKYFILEATELRDIGPFGQEYLFYKRLVETFRQYAIAIIIISISLYIYLEIRGKKVKI
jgi:signal peptidase